MEKRGGRTRAIKKDRPRKRNLVKGNTEEEQSRENRGRGSFSEYSDKEKRKQSVKKVMVLPKSSTALAREVALLGVEMAGL